MNPAVPQLPSKKQINRLARLLVLRADATRNGDEKRVGQLDPAELAAAERVVDLWRATHAYPLTKASANLRHYGRAYPGARPTQRLKKHSTIVDKLRREPTMQLTTMEDVGGCRLVLPDLAAVRGVARALKKNWRIVRDRDYVELPKDDGYRARHLVAVKAPRRIEIQLRTPLQDLWANQVERVGRAVADELKSGGGPPRLREYYRVVAEALEAEDHGWPIDAEMVARVQEATSRMHDATVDQ